MPIERRRVLKRHRRVPNGTAKKERARARARNGEAQMLGRKLKTQNWQAGLLTVEPGGGSFK